jgi:hypothetical protein
VDHLSPSWQLSQHLLPEMSTVAILLPVDCELMLDRRRVARPCGPRVANGDTGSNRGSPTLRRTQHWPASPCGLMLQALAIGTYLFVNRLTEFYALAVIFSTANGARGYWGSPSWEPYSVQRGWPRASRRDCQTPSDVLCLFEASGQRDVAPACANAAIAASGLVIPARRLTVPAVTLRAS